MRNGSDFEPWLEIRMSERESCNLCLDFKPSLFGFQAMAGNLDVEWFEFRMGTCLDFRHLRI
jgi:hypothetical protein